MKKQGQETVLFGCLRIKNYQSSLIHHRIVNKNLINIKRGYLPGAASPPGLGTDDDGL